MAITDKQTGKDTVIGPETRISGEVRGDEDLVVRGRVDGKISLSQTLTVEAGGIVQADVEVRSVVVSGVLLGNVIASDIVRLTDKSKVIGNLSAPRIIIEAGAAYRGRVEMGGAGAPRGAEKRQSSEKSSSGKAPPRMAPPPRIERPDGRQIAALPAGRLASPSAASNGSRHAGALPRVASAPVTRSGAIPGMPRPESVSVGAASSPGWAKKKLRRK